MAGVGAQKAVEEGLRVFDTPELKARFKSSRERLADYFSWSEKMWANEEWFWDRDWWRETLTRYCGLGPGSKILDMGCGNGALLRVLNPSLIPGGSAMGIDRNEVAVEAGNRFDQEHGFEGIQLTLGDCSEATRHFGESQFDIVTEVGMLCSTPYPESVHKSLAEIVRLLKPGGFFVSLEEELAMIMSGAWMSPGVEEAQQGWLNAMTRGFMATKRSNTRIAPEMMPLMQKYGFVGLRTRPYCVPDCSPPFTQAQVDRIKRFAHTFLPNHPDYTVHKVLLEAGGLTSDQVERYAATLHKWWTDRGEMMARGEKPVLNRQIYLLTIGKKPL